MLTVNPEFAPEHVPLNNRPGNARFRISRNTILLLCCTAIMVSGAVTLSLQSFRQVSALSLQRIQTRIEIDNINRLLSSIKDAETSQRGYLLTGDETYLASWDAVRSATSTQLDALRKLPVSRSSQKRIEEIEQLTNAKMAELAQTIAMKRRHESDAAIALVMSGHGKQLMDQLRTDIATILEEQRQIQNQEIQQNEIDQCHLFEGIAATSLLALLLSMTTALLIFRSARHYVNSLQLKETKRLQQLQQESYRQLHAVIDSAMDAIITVDDKFIIRLFNPAACEMYGVSESEALGVSIEKFIPEQLRLSHLAHMQEFSGAATTARQMGNQREIVGLRANGQQFQGEATISQVTVSGKKMFTVIVRDQTNRLLAEHALRESRAFNIATLNSVQAEIAVLDREGTIIAVNQSWMNFARLNCFADGSLPELVQVGANYLTACKNSMAQAAFEGIKAVIAGTSASFELSYPCPCAKGDRWFHMSVTPLQDASGKVVIAHTDISEINLTEKALQASQNTLRDLLEYQHRNREQEHSRLAQVVHDELGTRLTAAKANLSVLMTQDQQIDSGANPRLQEACELLDSCFTTVRNIILDLRPSVLDNLGIWSALEWYAGKNALHTGIFCNFFIDPVLEDHVPAPELSAVLFRILQEALSNVTRHANATEVSIRVGTDNGDIKLEVEDNGTGIDMNKAQDFKSWGITGMSERARYLGGRVEIAQTAQGTLITAFLPWVTLEE